MPPIRPDDHAYRFRPGTIRELRESLNLTQAQMADLLEIPTNTLSRWETGSNLPDANALAAIYSIATDRGVTPQFFEEREKTMEIYEHDNYMIAWNYDPPTVKVGPWPDLTGWSERYFSTSGCCYGSFLGASRNEQAQWLQGIALDLLFDGHSRSEVLREFSKIRVWREMGILLPPGYYERAHLLDDQGNLRWSPHNP